jgi:HPt (histidine-containing phosphotransfer) domain-containing protein
LLNNRFQIVAMSEQPVIDPQAIENLRSLNPDDGDEFLREIAGIFLEDTPQRIAELDRSFAAADTATFARAAHSIKGSSANLGAMALRSVAEKLEQHVKTLGIVGTDAAVAEIKAEFARAQAELLKLVAQ